MVRVPLLGAIVRCHYWVPLLSGHVGGLDVPSDRVPLLGAMVRCHCWGGRGLSAHVGGVDVPSDRVLLCISPLEFPL